MIPPKPFWEWITDLVKLKIAADPKEAAKWAEQAAFENRKTGVGLIGEHSDLPVSAQALKRAGILGTIFQETITLESWHDPLSRRSLVAEKADRQRTIFEGRVFPIPHAPYSVDPETLRSIGDAGHPFSIHVAESPEEKQWISEGSGPIAKMFEISGIESPHASSSVTYLDGLGAINSNAQLVHCCTLSDSDIALIADRKASVAHCPRSNRYLQCPPAPIRRLLDRGVWVGLGMDSAASGGAIDMFAEMRSALDSSFERGEALSAETVWWMATGMGAQTLGVDRWDIEVGAMVPLIAIESSDEHSVEELIMNGSPKCVTWLSLV
jgi:cytosine/adenosine deaminase-related metal-dependent hydrolase